MPRNEERPGSEKKPTAKDDEASLRRSKNGSNEPDRPSKQRERDVESERPRNGRSRDEDLEVDDERPSPQKDRPSKRKARSRRGSRKKGKGLLLAGLAILLVVGVGAMIYFFDPIGSLLGGPPKEMLAWMPAETTSIEFVDVNEIRKFDQPYKLLKEQFQPFEQLGIPLDSVDAIMAGGKPLENPRDTIVIRLSKPIDRDSVVRAAKGQELSSGEQKYYKTANNMGLHFASDRLVVLSSSSVRMPRMLDKSTRAELHPNLRSALRRTKGNTWTAMGHDGGNTSGGELQPGQKPTLSDLPTRRHRVVTAKYSADQVEFEAEYAFMDSESARRAAKYFEVFLKGKPNFMTLGGSPVAQELGRMHKSASILESGTRVTIRMKGGLVRGVDVNTILPN